MLFSIAQMSRTHQLHTSDNLCLVINGKQLERASSVKLLGTHVIATN